MTFYHRLFPCLMLCNSIVLIQFICCIMIGLNLPSLRHLTLTNNLVALKSFSSFPPSIHSIQILLCPRMPKFGLCCVHFQLCRWSHHYISFSGIWKQVLVNTVARLSLIIYLTDLVYEPEKIDVEYVSCINRRITSSYLTFIISYETFDCCWRGRLWTGCLARNSR